MYDVQINLIIFLMVVQILLLVLAVAVFLEIGVPSSRNDDGIEKEKLR